MRVYAFVGMPGAGKSVGAEVAKQLGIPVFRFGDVTDDELKKQGLERNEANERRTREGLRKALGMGAYAQKIYEKVQDAKGDCVVLDGMRSFEEYLFFREKYGADFVVISIISTPKTRYRRLANRKERTLTEEEARERDVAELVNLNMGPTICMGDVVILNERISRDVLKDRIRGVLRDTA